MKLNKMEKEKENKTEIENIYFVISTEMTPFGFYTTEAPVIVGKQLLLKNVIEMRTIARTIIDKNCELRYGVKIKEPVYIELDRGIKINIEETEEVEQWCNLSEEDVIKQLDEIELEEYRNQVPALVKHFMEIKKEKELMEAKLYEVESNLTHIKQANKKMYL